MTDSGKKKNLPALSRNSSQPPQMLPAGCAPHMDQAEHPTFWLQGEEHEVTRHVEGLLQVGTGVPQPSPLPVGGSSPGAALAASPQPVGAADGMLWDGGSGWMLWDGAVDGCCGAHRVAPLAAAALSRQCGNPAIGSARG